LAQAIWIKQLGFTLSSAHLPPVNTREQQFSLADQYVAQYATQSSAST